MKKLSIADIKATEILSKEEKKNVVGGGGSCGLNCWKDGKRTELRNWTKSQALEQLESFKNDADANTWYDKCYWCCESC